MRISAVSFYNTQRVSSSLPFKSFKDVMYPDIKQHNDCYCAPSSAASAIISINDNRTDDANKLVEDLAKLLKTDSKGTTSDNFCKGIDEYLKQHGKHVKIEYSGFRPVDTKYKTSEKPDFDKIKQAIKNGDAVVLNLGIYKKSGSDYVRQYGHFVNAVAAGSDGLSFNESCLSITDPYNKIDGLHYIKLTPMQSGKFAHNKDDNEIALTDNAAGFYEITPKFNYFEKDETAVLNGVIIISKIS